MPQVLIFEIFLGKYKKTFLFFFKNSFWLKKMDFFSLWLCNNSAQITKKLSFPESFSRYSLSQAQDQDIRICPEFQTSYFCRSTQVFFGNFMIWLHLFSFIFFLLRGIFFFSCPCGRDECVLACRWRVLGLLSVSSVLFEVHSRTFNEIPVS